VSASQYEVFENPIPRARRAFPFVAILQSDLADTGSDRIIAPLVPRARIAGAVGRLMPIVKVLGVDHVLVVPRMVPMTAADFRTAKDGLTGYRNEIVAALELLFLGV
jgi:toxin CcdB